MSSSRQIALTEVASLVSGGTPRRGCAPFWGGGVMPWVTGKDFKRFYVDSSEERLSEVGAAELNEVPSGATLVLVRGMMLLNHVPVALATVPLRINQDVRALVPLNGVNGEFIAWSVRAREEQLRASVDLAGHGTGRLATEFLRALHIWLPERRVQDKVVRVLSAWERSHQILSRLLGAKRQMRDGVASALLTGRRRLPGFARQPWRDVCLGEVTRESTRRNGDRLGTDRVMAVTKSVGLTPMRDRTMSDSLARYKVLRPGGFAYNPMRLNIGSIARSSFKRDVLVSPDYVVFEAVPESLDPRFLDYTRRAHAWRRFMMAAGSGGVRIRIYYDDLARLRLPLPGKEEQSRIADFLDTAFQEIACLTLLRETIAKQKRGLMQGLLTGKIRIKEDSHG